MKEYVLKIAQSGFAAGGVFNVEGKIGRKTDVTDETEMEDPASYHTAAGDPRTELLRFDKAVLALKQELMTAAEHADERNAAIFEAEQMLLEDDGLAGAVRRLISGKGQEAISSVLQTGYDLEKKFAASKSSYLRTRSDDVKGITHRLLELLRGTENRVMTIPSIIVAEELSPLQLSGFDTSLILGIITVGGTPLSHVSVMAGNLGIPYVYGLPEAVEAAHACSRLIIDGEKLILDPDDEMYQQALLRMEENRQHGEVISAGCGERCTKVLANISGPEDIEALCVSGAEGVGLFRTEFLFLGRDCAPTEEEQFEAYRSVAEAMGERETIIRTMDLGSDKRPAWMSLPEEKNPALGWRGLRISLKERELFKTQLRALLRVASYGNVKILVPMVTSVREIEAVNVCITECAGELTMTGVRFGIPPLGVMVETPAAALIAEQLAQKVDFFSIGTNDLSQYTMALDREAEGLEDFDDPCHEAVLKLIRMTAQAGARNNISTSVCGELAGDPALIKSLISAGVEKLSVSVPKVKTTIRYVAEAEKALKSEINNEAKTDIIR